MKDLNSVVPPGSIYMLIPYAINYEGEVAGFGVTSSGEIHGFLASPFVPCLVAAATVLSLRHNALKGRKKLVVEGRFHA
jgi:hypothetical protein